MLGHCVRALKSNINKDGRAQHIDFYFKERFNLKEGTQINKKTHPVSAHDIKVTLNKYSSTEYAPAQFALVTAGIVVRPTMLHTFIAAE